VLLRILERFIKVGGALFHEYRVLFYIILKM